MSFKNTFLFFIALTLISACGNDPKQTDKRTDYEKRWATFKTKLTKQQKAPQTSSKLKDEGSIKAINYSSNGLELQALLETKNIVANVRKPVLIYLHGGFGLGMSDVADCQIFTDNDFIVFAPSYRGENQNGGNYELLLGEVADAKEAIRWIAKQPFADTTKIYTFGHSIGGAVSLNLSLHSDIPVRLGGSSAGLYPVFADDFEPPFENTSLDDIEKFSNVNPETEMRLAIYHFKELRHKHYMYVGKDDHFDVVKNVINYRYSTLQDKFILKGIEGNHFSSLQPAFEQYLEVVKEDMKNK